MMVHTTEAEMDRLRIAKETKKYGHLQSWKELFMYQRYCGATDEQIIEISSWAKRRNKGEKIILPLMNHGKQESI